MNAANPHLAGIQGQRLSPNLAPDKRLRIRIDLGQKPASQNLSNPVESTPRPDPKTIDIKIGTTGHSYRYWKTKWTNKKSRRVYHSYVLTWFDGLKPRREKRNSFKKLRARAQEIATLQENNDIARLQLTPADQASFLRAKELLAPIGRSLEMSVGEYADSVQLLHGRASVLDAVRDYLVRHPDGMTPRDIPKIVGELKLRHGKKPRGEKWKKNLHLMLDRFVAKFTGPLTSLIARDVDDWLDSLKNKKKKQVDLQTRHNYRAAVVSVVDYAKARGYVPKDFNIMQDVSDPEAADKPVNIYTPKELAILLHKAESHHRYKNSPARPYQKLVPLIAITAFAGVRHGEMNEDKLRLLDWSDFDWDTNRIYIDGQSAKKTRRKDGDDRVVDMPDNLVEWLKPYAQSSGKICDLKNTGDALCRLRALAGIKGNHRNSLRKSFITYRLAILKDIAAVADEAGNSPGTIKKRYKAKSHTRLKEVAERWFSIKPCRAEVLPLWQLAGK